MSLLNYRIISFKILENKNDVYLSDKWMNEINEGPNQIQFLFYLHVQIDILYSDSIF